jgi:hypothetical protein
MAFFKWQRQRDGNVKKECLRTSADICSPKAITLYITAGHQLKLRESNWIVERGGRGA